MEEKKAKILIVDDEPDIRKVVRLLLSKKGYIISEVGDGESAVSAVENDDIDLIIMDIMMPKMSGVEATKKIRENSFIPILFLTAKSLDKDKEGAYFSGGDDYLVKPFSSVELLLKVESLLRRYMIYNGKGSDKTDDMMLLGGVCVNSERREVSKNGIIIDLRGRESDMFFYLLEHRGEIVETGTLYEAVWGEPTLSSGENNVMVNMLSLRKKLEDDPSSPRLLKTVWGRGYLLE